VFPDKQLPRAPETRGAGARLCIHKSVSGGEVTAARTEAARRGRQSWAGRPERRSDRPASPHTPDALSASGTPPARGCGPASQVNSSANPAGRRRQRPGSSRGIDAAPPGGGRHGDMFLGPSPDSIASLAFGIQPVPASGRRCGAQLRPPPPPASPPEHKSPSAAAPDHTSELWARLTGRMGRTNRR
jgi:hypothetical protein